MQTKSLAIFKDVRQKLLLKLIRMRKPRSFLLFGTERNEKKRKGLPSEKRTTLFSLKFNQLLFILLIDLLEI